jgi:hypothetical protein
MGNAAKKIEYQTPLVELVEKITTAGKITTVDQKVINQSAKMPLDNIDVMAIRHLTDLIRDGVVKVI